jgi:hypothetical protein
MESGMDSTVRALAIDEGVPRSETMKPVLRGSSLAETQVARTLAGVIRFVAFRKPYLFVTWTAAAAFGMLYLLEDQIVAFDPGVANFSGVNLPTQILLFGPEPMQGPPQVAYYLTVLGRFGTLQFNLSGIVVVGILATLFGINISLVVLLQRRMHRTGAKSFGSLLAIFPSLLSTSSSCCGVPLYLLLLGYVAAGSFGLSLLPYLSVFVYASFAMVVFNIYYFGKKTIAVCGANECRFEGPAG